MKTVICDACGRKIDLAEIDVVGKNVELEIDGFLFAITIGHNVYVREDKGTTDNVMREADLCRSCREKYKTRILNPSGIVEAK